MALTSFWLGSPWVAVRLIASVLMGTSVLPPPATFTPTSLAGCLAVHLPLSVGFACLLAFMLHRWGLIVGVVGGALFGLALYYINFYSLTFFFPWLYPMRSWMMMLSHVTFGILAGGLYEALEVEQLEPVAG
jgi:hypothetical protein